MTILLLEESHILSRDMAINIAAKSLSDFLQMQTPVIVTNGLVIRLVVTQLYKKTCRYKRNQVFQVIKRLIHLYYDISTVQDTKDV